MKLMIGLMNSIVIFGVKQNRRGYSPATVRKLVFMIFKLSSHKSRVSRTNPWSSSQLISNPRS